jgi:membrane-associated protein
VIALVAALAQEAHHGLTAVHVDYAGLALLAAVSWIGATGPGEAALIAAGILASHGNGEVGTMILVAWGGALAGGIVGWLVGLHGGRALMARPGPLHHLRLRMLRHGDAIYARRGWLLAVYLTPSWMAGVSGMRARRFLPANALASLAWALTIGGGAYLAGPSVADIISDLGTAGLVALLASVALTALVRAHRAH